MATIDSTSTRIYNATFPQLLILKPVPSPTKPTAILTWFPRDPFPRIFNKTFMTKSKLSQVKFITSKTPFKSSTEKTSRLLGNKNLKPPRIIFKSSWTKKISCKPELPKVLKKIKLFMLKTLIKLIKSLQKTRNFNKNSMI